MRITYSVPSVESLHLLTINGAEMDQNGSRFNCTTFYQIIHGTSGREPKIIYTVCNRKLDSFGKE